jgi:hypothetical protein
LSAWAGLQGGPFGEAKRNNRNSSARRRVAASA